MPLLDSVFNELNVQRALRSQNKKGAPGIDGQTIQQSIDCFITDQEVIHQAIANGTYIPSPAKRIYIQNEEKQRPIDLLTGRDRILQRMVSQILSIQFDASFSNSSHGFRPERGRQTAARQIMDLFDQGNRYVLQLDISKYFQNVNRDMLMNLLAKRVNDPALLQFIGRSISAGYYENDQLYRPEKGIPQGSPISPILSNIYLNELDQELDSRSIPFVRYADDDAVITSTHEQAEVVFRYLQKWLPEKLGLPLSVEKTKIVPAEECRILGYDFLQDNEGKWLCNPPLPNPIKHALEGPQKIISARTVTEDKVIHLDVNSALWGIREVVLDESMNKWMPKPEANRIKKAACDQINIMELAQAMGFTVVQHTSETVSLAEHDSCVIWPATNKFKRFSATDKNGRTIGGTPFDFYLHFSGASYMQALNVFKSLVSETPKQQGHNITQQSVVSRDLTPMERDMKLKDEIARRNVGDPNMKRVFAYLIQTRKIDPAIVSEQASRGCLEQITDDKGRTHCLFIGYDENGLMSTACFRSTSSTHKFMGDISGCDYSKGWFFDPQWDPKRQQGNAPDPSKTLLCFESSIEMMSYMTILKDSGFDYRNFAYLSCGSVSKSKCIDQTCAKYGYKQVKVMFNNDREQEAINGENPGRDAAEKTAARLTKSGIKASVLVPSEFNDWNDKVKAMRSKSLQTEKKRTNKYDIGR